MKEKELEEKEVSKKKNIALKTSIDLEDSDEEDDEDLALLIRKFKRFMKKGNFKVV